MSVRRIVTGFDRSGRSVFASDETLSPLASDGLPGTEMTYVWGSEDLPMVPNDGSMPWFHNHFPAFGGWRYVLLTLAAADDEPGPASVTALADAESKFPGLLAVLEKDEPGMHTSSTVDIAMVLSGEVVLELDDKVERTLRAGDVIVQNGTRHRWANRGPEPVHMAFIVMGAMRTKKQG